MEHNPVQLTTTATTTTATTAAAAFKMLRPLLLLLILLIAVVIVIAALAEDWRVGGLLSSPLSGFGERMSCQENIFELRAKVTLKTFLRFLLF
jgi:hypothetical protein